MPLQAQTRVLATVLLLVAGCVHERTKELVRVPEGALSRGSGGSSSLPPPERASAAAAADGWDRLASVSRPEPLVTAAVTAAPVIQTSAAPRAHARLAAGTTLGQVAREKFMNAVTTIDADKATVYVPAEYAEEVALAGARVVDDGPGRRTADGSAVLTLRHLTIRARRVTLVVRSETGSDFQVSARGAASLRSDQPSSLLEETGLRSLLLKNDGYVPLR